MVEITIIIEGGVLDGDTVDVATAENSQALRESLNKVFSQLLNTDVGITIQMGAGYRNATKQFCNSKQTDLFLYCDLDDTIENASTWFNKLETEKQDWPIVIPVKKRERVFFMVQEMEAWLLKQPEAIERWGVANNYTRLDPTKTISEHSLIANKNVEEIKKPSSKLYDLIKHFWQQERRGKKKKVQYGKLKSAPGLLDQLNVQKLAGLDSELQRFRDNVGKEIQK